MAPMDAGRCRSCGRPFTSGEVTGVGILRPRPATAGGPFVEFACPGCKTVLRLVPHGQGRYGVPGAPPPPPPSEDERRVPWKRATTGTAEREAPAARPAPPPRAARAHDEGPAPEPERAPPPRREGAAPTEEDPKDALAALRVLGVRETATIAEIESAYRDLALRCHPDKVAHLDPDFVALAERKFRRLQAARDLLLGS